MPATPAWPPKSAPRLFVEDELGEGRTFALDGNRAHYLGKVMRVSEGDTVILCDDVTGEWAARVGQVDKRRVDVTVVERLREREAVPDLWLCPALLKKDRFDLVLEKATELGVAAIRPVVTRLRRRQAQPRTRGHHRHRGRRAMCAHRAAAGGRAGEARCAAGRLASRARAVLRR